MTDNSKDGGPAFPCETHHGEPVPGGHGMTLRDWFAGQALTGILGTNYEWFTSGTETGSRTHEAATFAYSLADAMRYAREAQP